MTPWKFVKMGMTFKNLPLVEVIVRAATSQIIPMDLANIGRLADVDEFGEAKFLQKPWQGVGAVAVMKPEGLPFGVEFRGTTGIDSVVQSDLVATRWTAMEPGSVDYVGFEALVSVLSRLLETLQGVEVYQSQFRACNMSYTSVIESADAPTTRFVKRYFKGLLPECSAEADLFYEINTSWKTDKIDIRAQINRVFRAEDIHGLRVSTTAGHIIEEGDIIDSITQNHTALQKFFPTLLTDEAKKEWEYENGST